VRDCKRVYIFVQKKLYDEYGDEFKCCAACFQTKMRLNAATKLTSRSISSKTPCPRHAHTISIPAAAAPLSLSKPRCAMPTRIHHQWQKLSKFGRGLQILLDSITTVSCVTCNSTSKVARVLSTDTSHEHCQAKLLGCSMVFGKYQ
jgi:hypothetical protein